MEALNFLRFWKTTTIATMPFTITEPIMVVDYISCEEEEEEEDDSFFDLEITSQFANKETQANSEKHGKKLKNQIITPNEFVSKRKILPIVPSSPKPQSPIALLKNAQTFRVFKFKKPKLMASKSIEREKDGKKCLSVKFKIEDVESNMPKLTRETSVKSKASNVEPSSSKGLDLVQKYLNMFKPLYEKVSTKKINEKVKCGMDFALHAKMKQGKNVPGGVKVACGGSSPAVMRRDDSLLEQVDGIQDAILHCKRSFNSSTESSMDLSRKSAEEMRDNVGS